MHELSIALGILEIAEEEAARQRAGRVTAIHLELGPLSGVEGEALRSAFELAREGTGLEDADLVIKQTALVTYCPNCAVNRTVESIQELCCPECGAPTPEIVRGRELDVIALEVES
jgi:hydrogenase nickel incorporation protein HypA/HybF